MESIKKTEITFFILCFIALIVFFFNIHTLVLYDGDDWSGLSRTRAPWPLWGNWNPIKILPETMMPICGYLAAYVFYPFMGNYVYAVSLCSAIIFSAIITVYAFCFYKFIKTFDKITNNNALVLTVLFLITHFILFKTNKYNSVYLLYSYSLTNYFHYLLPALLNCSIVLFLMRFKNFLYVSNLGSNSLFLICIYFAIFSNVYHSVIVITYIFISLIIEFLKTKNNISVKKFLKENKLWITILLIWLLSLIFEANGGRSNQIGYSILELPLEKTVLESLKLLQQISIEIFIFYFAILISAFCLYKNNKNKIDYDFLYKNNLTKTVISGLCIYIYVILVSAKAYPTYASRTDVSISFLFFIILSMFISIAYFCSIKKSVIAYIPLLTLLFICFAINTNTHFKESNIINASPKTCISIDNDLIEQIVFADKNNKKDIVLKVPKGHKKDNWPHPLYAGKNISRTLYSHNIITKEIKIIIKPDINMNKKYNIK